MAWATSPKFDPSKYVRVANTLSPAASVAHVTDGRQCKWFTESNAHVVCRCQVGQNRHLDANQAHSLGNNATDKDSAPSAAVAAPKPASARAPAIGADDDDLCRSIFCAKPLVRRRKIAIRNVQIQVLNCRPMQLQQEAEAAPKSVHSADASWHLYGQSGA